MRPTEPGRSARQRPAHAKDRQEPIDPATSYLIAIDLGGTKLHLALADLEGRIRADRVEATAAGGGTAVIAQIADLSRKLAIEAGFEERRPVVAMLGSPGMFDRQSGRVALADNIPGFDAIHVLEALRETLGIEVLFENDANLGAWGEFRHGAGQTLSPESADLAFITLGTGVGLGLILGGRLLHGGRGAAGEIAYLPIGGDPSTAEALRYGAFENTVATQGMIARYAAAGGGANVTVRDIFERLRNGDKKAEQVIEETAAILALGILSISALVDPALLVLGGGIGATPEMLAATRRALKRGTTRPIPIEPALLGSRGALLGAIDIGLEHLTPRLRTGKETSNAQARPTGSSSRRAFRQIRR